MLGEGEEGEREKGVGWEIIQEIKSETNGLFLVLSSSTITSVMLQTQNQRMDGGPVSYCVTKHHLSELEALNNYAVNRRFSVQTTTVASHCTSYEHYSKAHR